MDIKKESILDKPQEDLDKVVWTKNEDLTYSLTEEATKKIENVVKFMITENSLFPISKVLNNFGVNITGSITSNQYTEDSDIDLHFNSPDIKEDEAESYVKEFRKLFEEGFKSQFGEDAWHIGKHPIEVYFQANPFQDYMSVGCYDFINKKWLVGPEFKEMDYDPYQDLYNQDMRHINSVIGDIRNVILECFETAIAIKNSDDEDFKEYEFGHLKDRITKAAMIFKNAQEYRKVYSAPKSIEQAKMYRDSRKWKIADSSFKLLDKFGYLRILRTLTQCYEKISDNENGVSRDIILDTIIDVIKDNFSSNKNLTETEMKEFNNIDEGLLQDTTKFMLLAGLLAIPGLTDIKALAGELSKLPEKELHIDSPAIPKAIADTSKDNEVINGLYKSSLINIIATIIYNEAMVDYVKYHDKRCLIAIGNVINNRAGGLKEKMAEVVTAPDQFYSAKHIKGGIKNSNFKEYYPYKGNKECWELCNIYARQLVDGNLTNIIGNRNMVANKKLDNKDAFEQWGKDADLKIGSHTFGYDSYQDGFRKIELAKRRANKRSSGNSIYIVKKGDSIASIAKNNGLTMKELLKKNSQIKDINKISIGQKIKV